MRRTPAALASHSLLRPPAAMHRSLGMFVTSSPAWRRRTRSPVRAPRASCAISEMRLSMLSSLGAIGDSRAVQGLLPSLKDPDSGVRKQAAWAIGVLGR